MGAIAVETLMAALYTDHALRRAFLSDPLPVLDRYDLSGEERDMLLSTDRPGLVLAGNSFAYKRWKANQLRHAKVYTFASYDRVFDDGDLAPVRELFASRFAGSGITSRKSRITKKVIYTHPGVTSSLLPAKPGNQHNHEHVLMENPALAPVARIWRRLFDLNLRDHFLIRMYFYRATPEGLDKPERMHPRPGACATYVPLGPAEATPGGFVVALTNDQKTKIAREPLEAGRVVTYAADALQHIECAEGNQSLSRSIDLLCIKSLCTAV